MHMKITTVELVGTKLACRARAAVARGILPSPDPDPGRCQASSSAGSSNFDFWWSRRARCLTTYQVPFYSTQQYKITMKITMKISPENRKTYLFPKNWVLEYHDHPILRDTAVPFDSVCTAVCVHTHLNLVLQLYYSCSLGVLLPVPRYSWVYYWV